MCEKRLARLEMNIEALADYNKGINISPNVKELKVKSGKAMAYNLFRPADDSIAVAHVKAKPNTQFLMHYHPEIEVMTVFRGTLTVFIVDVKNNKIKKEISLIKGQTHVVEPGPMNAHYGIAGEYACEIIVSTIPASKGFPDND